MSELFYIITCAACECRLRVPHELYEKSVAALEKGEFFELQCGSCCKVNDLQLREGDLVSAGIRPEDWVSTFAEWTFAYVSLACVSIAFGGVYCLFIGVTKNQSSMIVLGQLIIVTGSWTARFFWRQFLQRPDCADPFLEEETEDLRGKGA